MSSFICEYCGEHILDSEKGYITGCKHYPLPEKINMTTTTFFEIPRIEIVEKKQIKVFHQEFDSCNRCPNYFYKIKFPVFWKKVDLCKFSRKIIKNPNIISNWCPLSNKEGR